MGRPWLAPDTGYCLVVGGGAGGDLGLRPGATGLGPSGLAFIFRVWRVCVGLCRVVGPGDDVGRHLERVPGKVFSADLHPAVARDGGGAGAFVAGVASRRIAGRQAASKGRGGVVVSPCKGDPDSHAPPVVGLSGGVERARDTQGQSGRGFGLRPRQVGPFRVSGICQGGGACRRAV